MAKKQKRQRLDTLIVAHAWLGRKAKEATAKRKRANRKPQ
jgi:hypothetical protein